MSVIGNSYTVAQIDQAVERAGAALARLSEGVTNSATFQLLVELYLGALDADKPQTKSAGGAA